jgi:hypothetical protein
VYSFIREIPGLNLGRVTGHADWGFLWVPTVSTDGFLDSLLKQIMTDATFKSLPTCSC